MEQLQLSYQNDKSISIVAEAVLICWLFDGLINELAQADKSQGFDPGRSKKHLRMSMSSKQNSNAIFWLLEEYVRTHFHLVGLFYFDDWKIRNCCFSFVAVYVGQGWFKDWREAQLEVDITWRSCWCYQAWHGLLTHAGAAYVFCLVTVCYFPCWFPSWLFGFVRPGPKKKTHYIFAADASKNISFSIVTLPRNFHKTGGARSR